MAWAKAESERHTDKVRPETGREGALGYVLERVPELSTRPSAPGLFYKKNLTVVADNRNAIESSVQQK